MREQIHVRQISGERRRRWFFSKNFDLIVWHDADGSIAGFELCYDKLHGERSIVWRPTGGFTHTAIDDGELRPGNYKASPVHVADGFFDAQRVHAAFAQESHSLPKEIAEYVLHAIEKHPDFVAAL